MFYENLIKLCDERGEKITPLLKNLELGTSGISRWRKGSSPTGETLLKLSQYFGVSIDYLLTGKETNFKVLEVPEDLKGIKLAFQSGEDDLTQEEIKEVSDFIQFVKSKRGK